MKTLFVILVLIISINFTAFSQSEETKSDSTEVFSVGADIVSRYVWRGLELSKSPAFQPAAAVNIGNLTIGAWGSYTFANESLQEADLYLTYTIGNLSITLNDYYNPVDTIEGGYFGWDSKTTRHALEGMFTFDGPDAFPVQFIAGVFIYGNDRDELTNDNLYSTYFEINRTWETGNYSVKPFLGVSANTSMYSNNGFQVVNLGVTVTKMIKFSPTFEMPLNVSVLSNPNKESVFIVLGVTF
jgi:hypothetical protein